jgi:uncharacterized membrane protein YfcA
MTLDAVSIHSDPVFWLIAGAAVTCLSLSKSGFVGLGLVATPLFTLVIPSMEAVAILLPVMLVQDYFSAFVYRRDWNGPTLLPTTLGAIVGIGLAWLLATHFPAAFINVAVGVIALVLALSRLFPTKSGDSIKQPAPVPGLIWGAISGFAGTLANAGGPPFLAYVLPQRLANTTFAATMALYCATINTMKVLPLLALGQLSIRNLSASAALMPLAVATTFLGIRLLRATRAEAFYRFTYVTIFLIAVALIWRGVATMLA